jgi:hypothetical protein
MNCGHFPQTYKMLRKAAIKITLRKKISQIARMSRILNCFKKPMTKEEIEEWKAEMKAKTADKDDKGKKSADKDDKGEKSRRSSTGVPLSPVLETKKSAPLELAAMFGGSSSGMGAVLGAGADIDTIKKELAFWTEGKGENPDLSKREAQEKPDWISNAPTASAEHVLPSRSSAQPHSSEHVSPPVRRANTNVSLAPGSSFSSGRRGSVFGPPRVRRGSNAYAFQGRRNSRVGSTSATGGGANYDMQHLQFQISTLQSTVSELTHIIKTRLPLEKESQIVPPDMSGIYEAKEGE